MTRQAENLDDILAPRRSSRFERLLDRLDTAVVSYARAIWCHLIEGFAACAEAQFVIPIGPSFDANVDARSEQKVVSAVLCPPLAGSKDELRGDFEDLQSLIESIRATS
jgi:hypothetical protein